MTGPTPEQPGSLSQFLSRHRQRALRFAQRLVGRSQRTPREEPEDVVQDASARLAAGPRQWQSESHFVHLFLRLVRTAAANRFRFHRVAKRGGGASPQTISSTSGVTPAADATGPATGAARREEHETMLRHLRRLKPEYQEVITLRLQEDLGWADVAARMNLPTEDAARKKFDYALMHLRRLNDQDGTAEEMAAAAAKFVCSLTP